MPASAVERSFILGLDGVPWDLVERWTRAGELPHLAELVESGASGPLQSTMPPTTAVAWPSIATGVRADKHGIYAFQQLEADYRRTINTSNAVKEPPIWEILTPAIVANVPMTYPADDIDGTMVTGMMTPRRDEGFTAPVEFAQALEEVVPDYEIGLAWHEYQGREEAFLDDLRAMVEGRRELMGHLMAEEAWRVFFFVYTAPDRLQHLIWDEEVILEHYRHLDAIVGEVMDYVSDRDANLFVVSDHGFGPVDEAVHVSRLLEDAGYLVRKSDEGGRGALERIGLDKGRLRSLLQRTALEGPLFRMLPQTLIDGVANRVPGDHGLYDVAFASSQAFAYSGRSIYINDEVRFENGIVPPAARDGIKKEVCALLETAVHPNTGGRLFDVYDGSELFPTDPQAPDLVVDGPPGTEVKSSLAGDLISPVDDRAASHRRTGIFFAWGPNIEHREIESATVYDVLPTVLHSQSRAIPRDVDGQVLEIFASGTEPADRRPASATYRRGTQDEKHDRDFESVEDRLRGLGYLD